MCFLTRLGERSNKAWAKINFSPKYNNPSVQQTKVTILNWVTFCGQITSGITRDQSNFWRVFHHLSQTWRAAVRRAVHVWLALLAREAPVF